MFMARRERSARHLRQSTLERRYDFHLGEAIRAALQGRHDKAAGHSGRALLISRELATVADPARHQPALAAALCVHAQYGGTCRAIEMLTESAGHYAVLAAAEPAAYEVPRIDVLTRIALASEAAGSTRDAISLLRETIGMYLKAPTDNADERDLSLARAHFHLGRCLRKIGMDFGGLAETEAGLELAADVLDRMRPQGTDPGWFAAAPRYLQLVAPDWAAAAASCMALYAQAGRWQRAAAAARTAIVVSGGLAELGGDTLRDAHEDLSARAAEILARARAARPVVRIACQAARAATVPGPQPGGAARGDDLP